MIGQKIAHFILSKRYFLLGVVIAITGLSIYLAKDVRLKYQMPSLLPNNHKDHLVLKDYLNTFGEAGFQVLVGVKDKEFYSIEKFNKWYQLGREFNDMGIIDSVFSEANFYLIEKNDSLKKFEINRYPKKPINSIEELEAIKSKVRDYPFFKNIIYNDSTNFHALVLNINMDKFNSEEREGFVTNIKAVTNKYSDVFDSEFYYTGLPFIRAENMESLRAEVRFFMVISLLATVLVLFFFFRSFKVILVASVIVSIGVCWTLGLLGLFDYEVSALIGMLPSIIIVIGIPNCVYLINKYQQVYIETQDKELALKTVIQKIGHITLITNFTTAFGLGTFVFTNTQLLVEFGVVAFISILLLFFQTVVMVPTLFSFMPAPKEKHTKHLEKGWLSYFLKTLSNIVTNHRKWVYTLSILLVVFSIVGIYMLRTTGRLIDDLPKNNKARTDLAYIQEQLTGVMPLEVYLEVNKKGKYQQTSTVNKIDSIERFLKTLDPITKTVSYVDALKFVNQAFYNGNPEKYSIPKGRDKGFIKKYVNNSGTLKNSSFIDTGGTKARISAQMIDIDVMELDELVSTVEPKVDQILNPDKEQIQNIVSNLHFSKEQYDNDISYLDTLFDEFRYIENALIAQVKTEDKELAKMWYDEGVDKEAVLNRGESKLQAAIDKTYIKNNITGFSVPFAKGTKYLIKNLLISLVIAIVGIALLMFFLFKSYWMVFVSVLANLLPLLFTAGFMGYVGFALKPSTILVFSISLGIAVDDAIHFLAKFKQELKLRNGEFKPSVYAALKETGISMLYTSIILFFGFSVFLLSDYGVNQAIGLLISLTLLLAMLSNLVLLPSLLLTFQERIER